MSRHEIAGTTIREFGNAVGQVRLRPPETDFPHLSDFYDVADLLKAGDVKAVPQDDWEIREAKRESLLVARVGSGLAAVGCVLAATFGPLPLAVTLGLSAVLGIGAGVQAGLDLRDAAAASPGTECAAARRDRMRRTALAAAIGVASGLTFGLCNTLPSLLVGAAAWGIAGIAIRRFGPLNSRPA